MDVSQDTALATAAECNLTEGTYSEGRFIAQRRCLLHVTFAISDEIHP